MCGIVGIISKKGSMPFWGDDLFTELLRHDTIRGPDSTGVFGVTKDGKIDRIKGDGDGWVFTNSQPYLEFKRKVYCNYRIAIGHNRKATRGKVSPENAHPFTEGHITLVHNGTIMNAGALNDDVEVDSHAIAHALAEHDAATALNKINGAYALVWYDKKDQTLNLARNSQRPLCLVEYDDVWMVASEEGLILWLQGREGRKAIQRGIIPPEKIISFSLNDLSKFSEVEYEEYKHYIPPVYTPGPYKKPGGMQFYRPPNFRTGTGIPAQGDTVKFKIKDLDVKPVGRVTVYGHPLEVRNGITEVDTNILVQAALPEDADENEFLSQDKIFQGTLMYFRSIGQGPMAMFLKDVKIADSQLVDMHGVPIDKDELAVAAQNVCNKCNGPMDTTKLEDSVVRKRADGSWRLVCHTCVENARTASLNKEKDNNEHVVQ